MEIADQLSVSAFSHNRIIPNTRTFGYDPRYRLITATGKKHRTVTRKDPDVLVVSPDPNDYEPYTIAYAYDAVSNLTRNQEYAGGALHYKSGRLDLFNGDEAEAGSVTDPVEGNFRYDANGNTTHTPRHEALAYTHDNQVRYVNLNGGGEVRDFRHGDRRAVRLLRKNGVTKLTVYLGPFEYHVRKGATSYTKLVVHLRGQDRHAQAERTLAGADPDSLDLFFHHADHLGSGHVLTRDDGDLLSQEEYFPYGGASDRRDARNRYRFIGVERDEDTHLSMTGPRTYDPVSGRFLQGDPIAADRPHASPFAYAGASPIRRSDPGGYADRPPPRPAWPPPPRTAAQQADQMATRPSGASSRPGDVVPEPSAPRDVFNRG
jgi:RHS repeat-associated protein